MQSGTCMNQGRPLPIPGSPYPQTICGRRLASGSDRNQTLNTTTSVPPEDAANEVISSLPTHHRAGVIYPAAARGKEIYVRWRIGKLIEDVVGTDRNTERLVDVPGNVGIPEGLAAHCCGLAQIIAGHFVVTVHAASNSRRNVVGPVVPGR